MKLCLAALSLMMVVAACSQAQVLTVIDRQPIDVPKSPAGARQLLNDNAKFKEFMKFVFYGLDFNGDKMLNLTELIIVLREVGRYFNIKTMSTDIILVRVGRLGLKTDSDSGFGIGKVDIIARDVITAALDASGLALP